jgi:general secretion pathway protein E
VRELCPRCRQVDPTRTAEITEFLGEAGGAATLHTASEAGCAHCHHGGFVGRTAVFEYVRGDATFKEWLAASEHEFVLRKRLGVRGQKTMAEQARDLVLAGRVSVQDALRAVGGEV